MEELVQSDNQIENILLIALTLLVLMSVAIIIFFYVSRRKIIKAELEKAKLKIANQKEVIQATLITQEEERQRIAQDLHDAISSKLNIVSLHANFLTEENISTSDANKFGASILKVTTTVLESSRKIAHDLLPPTLEKFGLVAAIEELCEEVADSGAFEVKYSLKYETNSIGSDEELHIFRIVQELFSNSIKYASPSIISVEIESKEKMLSLQYKDDGRGFNLSEAKKAKGLGLSGLENRAAILNANLSIHSSPGNGITVDVVMNKQ